MNNRPSLFTFSVMLGVPSLGITFAVTILTAYLPSLLVQVTTPLVIGLIIGAEGFFGLFMPFVIGVLVDRVTFVSERIKYLVPAIVAMGTALVLLGLFRSLFLSIGMVALFYLGYYAYLSPYWALYPDVIPDTYSARSRSAEGAWRVVGSLAALVSGGFLLDMWRPLPFVLATCLLGLVTFELSYVVSRYKRTRIKPSQEDFRSNFSMMIRTVRSDASLRRLVIANACWNGTLQAIQAFVVLYFVQGLHHSHHFVSGIVFPIAAIGLLGMAPLAGKLADKFGYVRVLSIAATIYGFGVLLPAFSHSSFIIVLVPIGAAAATAAMILPYALFMRLLGPKQHGVMSGLFGFSRGVGSFLGPLLAGAAIMVFQPLFVSTNGYGAFWAVAGLLSVVSIFFIARVKEPTD